MNGKWSRNSCMRAVALGILLVSLSCTPMTGTASLNLLTRDLPRDSANLEFVTKDVVQETDTMTWCLFFLFFGRIPTHEGVLDRLLEKYDADVLVDGELATTTYGFPYIFMLISARATGRPARFVDRGNR
ncbi:MAG: hypothetical protein ACYTGW_01125 [Planctomycetota bacterium]|jgi:hypothetical protein